MRTFGFTVISQKLTDHHAQEECLPISLQLCAHTFVPTPHVKGTGIIGHVAPWKRSDAAEENQATAGPYGFAVPEKVVASH